MAKGVGEGGKISQSMERKRVAGGRSQLLVVQVGGGVENAVMDTPSASCKAGQDQEHRHLIEKISSSTRLCRWGRKS